MSHRHMQSSESEADESHLEATNFIENVADEFVHDVPILGDGNQKPILGEERESHAYRRNFDSNSQLNTSSAEREVVETGVKVKNPLVQYVENLTNFSREADECCIDILVNPSALKDVTITTGVSAADFSPNKTQLFAYYPTKERSPFIKQASPALILTMHSNNTTECKRTGLRFGGRSTFIRGVRISYGQHYLKRLAARKYEVVDTDRINEKDSKSSTSDGANLNSDDSFSNSGSITGVVRNVQSFKKSKLTLNQENQEDPICDSTSLSENQSFDDDAPTLEERIKASSRQHEPESFSESTSRLNLNHKLIDHYSEEYGRSLRTHSSSYLYKPLPVYGTINPVRVGNGGVCFTQEHRELKSDGGLLDGLYDFSDISYTHSMKPVMPRSTFTLEGHIDTQSLSSSRPHKLGQDTAEVSILHDDHHPPSISDIETCNATNELSGEKDSDPHDIVLGPGESLI